ncbi:DUF4132 domain-containing protein [Lentzea terrae]|uniref:DUF4132 domain-containing protein n=1 Tax=Lentzea terrae TaxID=2200761 RepID=UPI000DD4D652|nr:DUF4132 domain-containing protein [Lentzea terrae]
MHRWELVSGNSAKFWEIGQDGSSVTVRFGRLETAGQTQTKDLASPEAAAAHVAKLVAEKEKKGYQSVEAGDPAPATQPVTRATAPTLTQATEPAADENTWVMPKAWLRDVIRQRGFTPAPEFTLDQAKAAEARRRTLEHAETIERALSTQGTAPDLVEATRDHLAGRPDPLGAAAIATITDTGLESVHAWIEDHGVAFAAVATVGFMGTSFEQHWHERRQKWTNTHLRHHGRFHVDRTATEGHMLIAVRYALAVADDAQREEAETVLAGMCGTSSEREVRSFLLPWRADWFDEVARQSRQSYPFSWWLVPCSASSYDDFGKTGLSLPSVAFALYTAVYVLGPSIAPMLADELDSEYQAADSRKLVLKVLAALPTDEAFTILLDRLDTKYVHPALLSAMANFPARAARLLAERANQPEMKRLLTAHLLSHPHLDVPEQVAALLAEDKAETLPEATEDQLPPLLASPPWLSRRPQAKPVTLEDLPVPTASTNWEPGEREQWLEQGSDWISGHNDWRELLKDFRAGNVGYYENDLFLVAPEDQVRPLLADWKPRYAYGVEEWGKRLAARFGIDALAPLVRLAQSNPGSGGVILLPFATVETAAIMADWFARTKQPRRWGIAWLTRHREQAARLLIPAAAGKAGVARRSAEAAIRYLHGIGVDVVTIAAECGAKAVIDVVLSVDPLDVLPAKLPTIGEWADPRLLPQVLMRDRKLALSPEAAKHLLMTAALSKPGEIYAGLPIAREALDRESLAEFAWAVFEQWQKAGAPSKESWALSALGWFGDDSTVRALSPLIRNWPGESQHSRAVAGLDVLADIGTEVALSHLNSIAEKVSFKGLKNKAQEKVTQIAAELGLSRDQLSDRLVPRLGLDDAATLVIDYGPRQFTVGFDEHLKPFVLDPDGKRRKDLPKPGAKDDQAKAPQEHKRYTALKKDVRTVASDQIQRLERAMVNQRTWTAEEFHTVLAAHPLLWHLVRRLVWITDGGLSFRLAEDRTLAGASDDELTLPDNATVRVAHPVDLQDCLEAWGEVFADYEILQPFPQLGRPVHLVTSSEDLLPTLKKYCDVTLPIGKVLGLTKKGWVRGEPQDSGVECWITRPFPHGGALVASLEPGIVVGAVDEYPEISFPDIWFSPSGGGDWSAPKDAPSTFDIDPITLSELLSELESLQS